MLDMKMSHCYIDEFAFIVKYIFIFVALHVIWKCTVIDNFMYMSMA